MRARLLPAAPTRQACGSRGFSASTVSSDQVCIALRTPVVEEPPTLLRFTYPLEIDTGNENFFFRVRCSSDDFPERIRNERASPEAKVALAANTIHGNNKDAI